MSSLKLVNIVRLITTHNFEINQLPDNLKCVKCKLVLKDACLVPCGCTFCRVCIDDMIINDVEFCPGVSQDCGDSPLSSFVTDYRANNTISKLIVKCPCIGCMHECQLVSMEEHLKECQKKSVECLFRELGCTQGKLVAEEMNEHLQQGNSRHSEILIGIIANINRKMEINKREIEVLRESNEESWKEIKILKQRDEDSEREIEMLKHEVLQKEGLISSIIDQVIHLQNENKSIKQGKEDHVERMRILSEKIDREIEERRENCELDNARVIEHVDREIATITGMIRSENEGFNSQIKSIRDEILSINQGAQSIMDDIYSMKYQVQSIQALVGLVDARCELVIDDHVAEKSWNWGDTASDHFTGAAYPYKYRLSLCNSGGSLQIYLRIHSGPNDGQLAWPFEGRVVITVAEKDRLEMCRSISRQCRIRRPPDNYYSSSDKFDFSHSVLIGAGLDLSRGVCVSCEIVPDVGR